jgi:hypothetical protein
MVSLEVPRIIFDTAVFIDAANGVLGKGQPARRISSADWRMAVAYVEKNFLHAISPITAAELLAGVASGGAHHFRENKVALRKLGHSFRTQVELPFDKYFALREIFGREAPYPAGLEDNFMRIIDVVLEANSLDDLSQGRVLFEGKAVTVKLAALAADRRKQDDLCRRVTEQIRARDLKFERAGCESFMLSTLQLDDTPGNHRLLAERLDAHFYWEMHCYEKARDNKCSVDKVCNMLHDLAQLTYLAAPDITFVTRDMELERAASKSTQANRVLFWNAFLEKCTN